MVGRATERLCRGALGWACCIGVSTPALAQVPEAAAPPPAPAGEQERTEDDRGAEGAAPLPPAPELRLSMPAPAGKAEGGFAWSGAWRTSPVPSSFRLAPDSDLRLRIDTWRWNVGPLSFGAELIITPESERDCQPFCRGPGSSTTLSVKYDLGDIGPLKHVGPELQLGCGAAQPDSKRRDREALPWSTLAACLVIRGEF